MSNQVFLQTRTDIADYFKNPVMTKVFEMKGVGIYKCKVNSMLIASQQKYLVVLVKNDNEPIFTKKRLSDVNWFCFQTRQLGKNENISELDGLSSCDMPSGKSKSMFLQENITKFSQDENQVKYVCNTIPISVTLLVAENKNPVFQDTSSLERALMYFNTVINSTTF